MSQVRRRERQAQEGNQREEGAEQDENASVRTALQRLQIRPCSGLRAPAAGLPPTGLPRMKRKNVPVLQSSSVENGTCFLSHLVYSFEIKPCDEFVNFGHLV